MRKELKQVSISLKPVLTSSERIKNPKKVHTMTAPPTRRDAPKLAPRYKNQTRATAYSIVSFAKHKQ